MLQIKGIRKVYKTGGLVQEALKNVSLNLRDNEFVAILGPSGSGKTTLLNIIGGLDRYDAGDLIINGVSTKKYSERDWDSYRNHTVGFVFQSYNLIPHQTILKNVELALTISGISAKERAARAEEALVKVGLKEHIHKRPSQLSGGQMQRVAIARALVNDPDILLADEPTGALDSETSVQVMDLLKEVASDRLVVMVTHNPELAETYATRIVTLMDGEITSDSDPCTAEDGESVHKNMGKSSMSFLTALSLSFNNLRTKLTRTILVAFAGSIGIIGIAMILALSNGATEYINQTEEESLQSYPLTLSDTNFDFTSIYTDNLNADGGEEGNNDVTEMRLISALLNGVKNNDLKSLRAYLESDECDIYDYVQSLEYSYKLIPQIYKKYDAGYRQVNPDKSIDALGFFNDNSMVTGIVSSFSSTTTFNPLPEEESLYTESYTVKAGRWPERYDECVVVLTMRGKVPDTTLYNLGLKDPTELDELIRAYNEGTSTRVSEDPMTFDYEDFLGIEFKLISASQYYTYDEQHKLWVDRSENKKEMEKLLDAAETMRVVGVVRPNEDNLSPILVQGICYPASITEHLIELAKDTDVVKAQQADPKTDILTGKPFGEKDDSSKLDLAGLFSIDQKAIDKLFDPKSLDISDMELSSMDLSDIDTGALSGTDLSGIFPSLGEDVIQQLLESVQINITSDNMRSLFEDLLNGFTEYAKTNPDADIKGLTDAFTQYLQSEEVRDILRTNITAIIAEQTDGLINAQELAGMIQGVMEGYPAYLEENELSELQPYSHLQEYLASPAVRDILETRIEEIQKRLASLEFSEEDIARITEQIISGYAPYAEEHKLPTAATLMNAFADYLSTDEAKNRILKSVEDAVDASAVEDAIAGYTELMADEITAAVTAMIASLADSITTSLQSSMETLMAGISDNMLSAFNFDTDSLSKLVKFNMTEQELKDLMTSLLSVTETSYESNLRKLGYADIEKPTGITIYPLDYDSKEHIKEIIDNYNARMIKEGEEDKVVEYTDLVDALMSTVTTIINVISYILIAFVAISLVVSSIMIGVITYISVLERRKEIGILRAIGASKHNISSVFNAETFIIGSLAGLLGVGITELLIIPANIIIHAATKQNDINAILPPLGAVILVILSIVLTLIGGIIPSRKAAKSDPVTALRSE